MVLPTFSVAVLLIVAILPVTTIIAVLRSIAGWAERRGALSGARTARFWIGPPALFLELLAAASGFDRGKAAVAKVGLLPEWWNAGPANRAWVLPELEEVFLVSFGVGMAIWITMSLMRGLRQHAVMLRTLPAEEVSRYVGGAAWVRLGQSAVRGMRYVAAAWEVLHGTILIVAVASVGAALVLAGDAAMALLILPFSLAAYSISRVNAGPQTMLVPSANEDAEEAKRSAFAPRLEHMTTRLEGASMTFLLLAAGLVIVALVGGWMER